MRECVNAVPMLCLSETSQCEHDRDAVFFKLPCQHALFREQEEL